MSQMETLPSDLGHKIQSKLQRKLSRQGSLKGKNIKPKDPKDKTPLKSDLNLKFANEIENLGGTKHDLDMFKNLGDSGSDSELEIDSNGKNIDHGEVTDFMKSLGFKVEEQKNRQEKSVQKNNTKMEKSRGRQEKSSESHEADESMEVSAANGSRGSQKTAKRSKKAERQLQKEAEEQPSHIKRKPNTDVKSQSPKRQIQLGDVKDTLTPTLEPNTLWYSYDLDEPEDVITPLTDRDIETIHTHANNLLNVCNEQFEHDNTRSSSEKQFMSQLLTAGTLNDKVSALTLLIQESPLHSMKYFNMLHSQIKKKSKGSAMQAISAIKDLLIGGVLPNRKLKWFNKQPLQEDVDPKLLVLWAFEHWLKKYYFSFLETLEDPIVYIRTNAVIHIIDLLKSKPEQEVNLLRLGVNKLGDSDRKVASKVSYLLLDVEQVHPAMKSVVINAISELLFRTQDYHARYYSVITLNQTILTHKETEVANSLVKVYLMLFERLLTEWQKTKDFSTSHTPTEKVKKPRWKNKGGKGKKGGERQIQKTADTIKEEEVQRLTLAILSGLNRAYPFSELPREIFDKYLDSFYRVTHSANFNTSVQALTFIFQVSKSEKSLSDRYFRTLYESLLDPRLAVSSKLRLYLNLLFKSLREDDNITRLNAFVKRLLQMALHWLNIGIVASSLYLVAELKKFVPQLNNLIALPNNQVKNTSLSETHKEMSDAFYDGRARDPLYAHAVDVNLWELIPLLDHFHPTIKVYAEGLVNNIFLGRPDLSLHTLSHFLDRFVYKNPKQKVALKGTSIMQPLAGTTNGVTSSTTRKGIPANITDWSKVNLSEIDASEKFFYQYFTTRGERPLKEKHDKTQFGEFNEDEVWNALVHSKPEVEDDIEESDFSEFDYEDFSDEDDVEDMDEEKPLREVDEEESEPYSDFDKQSDKDEPSLIEEDISEGEESHDEVDDSNESGDEFIDEILNDLNDSDVSVYTNSSNEGVNIEDDQKEMSAMANKKKRRSKEDTSSEKSKRQKIKELPTFASVDDYAKYLESSDEDYS